MEDALSDIKVVVRDGKTRWNLLETLRIRVQVGTYTWNRTIRPRGSLNRRYLFSINGEYDISMETFARRERKWRRRYLLLKYTPVQNWIWQRRISLREPFVKDLTYRAITGNCFINLWTTGRGSKWIYPFKEICRKKFLMHPFRIRRALWIRYIRNVYRRPSLLSNSVKSLRIWVVGYYVN